MDLIIAVLLLLIMALFILLAFGFVWFARHYVSESQTLRSMLDKLSSESGTSNQSIAINDSNTTDQAVIHISISSTTLGSLSTSNDVCTEQRPSLSISIEELALVSSPKDDTAFQTPYANESQVLHSPANLQDIDNYFDSSTVPNAFFLPSSCEVPPFVGQIGKGWSFAEETHQEERISSKEEEGENCQTLQEEGCSPTKLQDISNNELEKVNGETEPVYPELAYDIALMSFSSKELGRGGFGTVKEAMYKDAKGQVSILRSFLINVQQKCDLMSMCDKVHHVAAKYAIQGYQDAEQTLRSELEIVGKVPIHKNIVTYFGGQISHKTDEKHKDREAYLVMELMHTNLDALIHGDTFTNGLTYRLVVSISMDIINGLNHLHQYPSPALTLSHELSCCRHGTIHYDLKSSNVLVTEDLQAKLADFGSSKRPLKTHFTASLRGTPGYIAPELWMSIFAGRMRVSEKLDIYSLGVVMWEMLTGKAPPNYQPHNSSTQEFTNPSIEIKDFNLVIPTFTMPPANEQNREICELIQNCLKMEPTLRPTTSEVQKKLTKLKNQLLVVE